MMVFSLAACTPTTEKNKTGEVKQTEAAQAPTSKQGPGVVTDKNPAGGCLHLRTGRGRKQAECEDGVSGDSRCTVSCGSADPV